MAKLTLRGLEEYERQLLKLRNLSRECIGEAIYAGAGVVADSIKTEIQGIPIDERHVNINKGEMLHGVSQAQKDGLLSGFGIARLQDDNGYLNVKVGFSGYNSVKTKSYPSGQPNSMIARSLNSGTSFRQKDPFVDRGTRNAKEQAERAMKEKLDAAINKIVS